MEGAIRPATEADLDAVLGIYDAARAFMRASGNAAQWAGAYPGAAEARRDLAGGWLWVLDEGAGAVGCMSVLPGPDPTYDVIEGAPWLNDEPYWVAHRVAAAAPGRGVGGRMLAWICARHPNLRADTHADNLPMQRALERAGFSRRGTIWVADGSPRIAYHFVRARSESDYS